jgi:hypothetical protein
VGDHYQERWERRQARWEARRAKWEARRARHEARRSRHAARRAAWEARRAERAGDGRRDRGRRPSTIALALLGGLFILLGLSALRLFPGFGSLVSFFVCLAPGAALLIPLLLRVRSRSDRSSPASARTDADPGQDTPRATAIQDEMPATAGGAGPQTIQQAPAGPTPAPEQQPQPGTRASYPDPSYYRERATGYRRRIQSIIRNRRPGPLADMMASVVANLQQWEERVSKLADRLMSFERDAVIQRDIKEVPTNIVRLQDQIERETDAGIHEQMQRTLAGYQSQQAMLDTLVHLMRRTRLVLDDTLVAMGTIYSQIRVIDAIDIDSVQAIRIAEELDEQVKRLNDLLAVLGCVGHGLGQPPELADDVERVRTQRGSAAGA